VRAAKPAIPPPPPPKARRSPDREPAVEKRRSAGGLGTPILVGLACGGALFFFVLGVLARTGYDHWMRPPPAVAQGPTLQSPADPPASGKGKNKPDEKERAKKGVDEKEPDAVPAKTPAGTAPEKTSAKPTAPAVQPGRGEVVDMARLKMNKPYNWTEKYDPATKTWTWRTAHRTPIEGNMQMLIDELPSRAPTSADAYVAKLKEKGFQEPGARYTGITEKGELPGGFYIKGEVQYEGEERPELGLVMVRKINGAIVRCRSAKFDKHVLKNDGLRLEAINLFQTATLRTTPLFEIKFPGGWVMLPDHATLIVSQPDKAQLVYFDTVADREVKRVECEFQPGALAVQGDTLFAAVRGSSQVYALDVRSGKVKKEYSLGSDAVAQLASGPKDGLLYASTAKFTVLAVDPATGAVTKTAAKGHFLALDPAGKFLYTGVQPPSRDNEFEIAEGKDGKFRIFWDSWGKRALLVKYAIKGKELSYVDGQNNAASNGWSMHLTPDGKRLMMVGGGGWRPPAKEGGTGGGYVVALFSTANLQAMVGQAPHGLNVAFHPVLNLGVTNHYGSDLTLFNARSLVKRGTIRLGKAQERRASVLTFGGKGRKLILWNGENVGAEQGLHFIPLELKPEEEQELRKSYDRR
jgi:hypothetical protein